MFQTRYHPFQQLKVEKDKTCQVVPDMAYSPREIIAKFSRGESVPLGNTGLYDEETSSPFEDDPTRAQDFDFGDYVEYSHELEERSKRAAQKSQRSARNKVGSDKRMSETQNEQAQASE